MPIRTSKSTLPLSWIVAVVAIAGCASAPPGGGPSTRMVLCGARGDAQAECKTRGYATSVRLVNDLGANACRQGSTLGFNTEEIWTKEGCRGNFEVTYRIVPQPRS